MHVASVPDLDRLIPFIRGFVDPHAVDEYGASALCAAVRAYNPPMVKEALLEHADPNSNCNGDKKWSASYFRGERAWRAWRIRANQVMAIARSCCCRS